MASKPRKRGSSKAKPKAKKAGARARSSKSKPTKAKPKRAKPAKTRATKTKPTTAKTRKTKPTRSKPVKAKATKAKPMRTKATKAKPAKAKPAKAPEGHERAAGERASELIDERIRELGGWRGATLARMRTLILEAEPAMTEEWKWMGTPVWSHNGNVCTGEVYTNVVKLTFAQGASIPDPSGLFNSSLEGSTRRAIDIHEGENVDADAFKALVKAAVTKNRAPGQS